MERFSLADAAFILRLLNEPSFIRHIADKGVRTLEDARDYLLAVPLASYAANGFGLYRVDLRESGVPIGMCGFLKRDTLPDPDLGYALLPEYCSRGFASEAVAAVMRHARDVLHLGRILAVTNNDNLASIRVLQKAGFRHAGMARLSNTEPELKLFASDL